jgi:hypothetical protein
MLGADPRLRRWSAPASIPRPTDWTSKSTLLRAAGLSVRTAVRRTARHTPASEKPRAISNVFQHRAICAPAPSSRYDTCGIKTISVPRARPVSGFTLLSQPCSRHDLSHVSWARMVREHDTRLWWVVHHCVEQACVNLSDWQRATFQNLPNVGACLSIRLAFQEVYDQLATESATGIPEKWYTGPPTAGSDR